jgi:hypothetical protein
MKPQETVKDRARQAYLDQQTQDSEGGCGQPIGFIYGFIAGEESAQSRIKTLESALVDMAKALESIRMECSACETLPRLAKIADCLAKESLAEYQELLSELKKEKG